MAFHPVVLIAIVPLFLCAMVWLFPKIIRTVRNCWKGSVRQMMLNVLFHQSHRPDGDPVPPRIFSGSATNVNSLDVVAG